MNFMIFITVVAHSLMQFSMLINHLISILNSLKILFYQKTGSILNKFVINPINIISKQKNHTNIFY